MSIDHNALVAWRLDHAWMADVHDPDRAAIAEQIAADDYDCAIGLSTPPLNDDDDEG